MCCMYSVVMVLLKNTHSDKASHINVHTKMHRHPLPLSLGSSTVSIYTTGAFGPNISKRGDNEEDPIGYHFSQSRPHVY